MGYGYYEFNDDFGPRGYNVEDTCNDPNCDSEIDRGMAYLCYACTGYFCGKHLFFGSDHECFAGVSGQVCWNCFSDGYDYEIENR